MSGSRFALATWRQWAGQALEERDRTRDRREGLLLGAAALFVLVNGAALAFGARPAGWQGLWPAAVWLTVVVAAHVVLRHLKPHRDPFLLPVFALLAGWGLLLQARLAPNFLARQTLWFVIATAALLFVACAPRTLQPLMRYRYVLLVGGLLLLAVTLIFGVNPGGSGAALWLRIPVPWLGAVFLQPSEPLKLLLVIFLASYFTEQEPLYRHQRRRARRLGSAPGDAGRRILRHLPFLGPLALMWGLCLLLLIWQQDLGAAALFFIVFVALLYLATGERFYVWSGLLLMLAAGVFAYFAFDAVVAPRILTWLNPWPNVSDRAYQVVQSLYAQGAGGVFGRGIGQGFPDYIPVIHSDFALAAVAEEWGLLGSLTIVAAFGILAVRGLRAALLALQGRRARFFHAYLGAGLVVLFVVQAGLIIGGVTKLLPLTGVTLPFVSYGGSSLLTSSVMLGLLLYLSADNDPALPARADDPRLARRIERLALAALAVLAVVALTLAYWGVVRAEALAARPDNPRLVEAERRVRRGRILDRNSVALAETVGEAEALRRVYPLAESGPAVGYYSLRFGSAGIERAFDAALRGQAPGFAAELWRRMLDEPLAGRDVRLTLDAGTQQQAAAAMAGRTGGLALLERIQTPAGAEAAVRALVSAPGYDPNLLEEQFETLAAGNPGPLFDRAAQGLYQPGLIVGPFIMAAAGDDGVLKLDDVVNTTAQPSPLNGQSQGCAAPLPGTAPLTWADVGRLRCPAPLAALGTELGPRALEDVFNRFRLTSEPALPIPTASGQGDVDDPRLAAVGQDRLTVSPLQAAAAAMALAVDGDVPPLRLVEAVAGASGAWDDWPVSGEEQPAVSPATAAAVRAMWPRHGDVAEYSVVALAGPGGQRNTWYLGFAPADSPRYVVALVLENVADPAAAAAIGRAALAVGE